ncbi:hypothetical protein C8R44DRAFT_873800 [Mycena epipterygia]|nr:hypothetical protein C8R44DRAFT_873800 [Mycena epipterygia]
MPMSVSPRRDAPRPRRHVHHARLRASQDGTARPPLGVIFVKLDGRRLCDARHAAFLAAGFSLAAPTPSEYRWRRASAGMPAPLGVIIAVLDGCTIHDALAIHGVLMFFAAGFRADAVGGVPAHSERVKMVLRTRGNARAAGRHLYAAGWARHPRRVDVFVAGFRRAAFFAAGFRTESEESLPHSERVKMTPRARGNARAAGRRLCERRSGL